LQTEDFLLLVKGVCSREPPQQCCGNCGKLPDFLPEIVFQTMWKTSGIFVLIIVFHRETISTVQQQKIRRLTYYPKRAKIAHIWKVSSWRVLFENERGASG